MYCLVKEYITEKQVTHYLKENKKEIEFSCDRHCAEYCCILI